FFFFVSSRPLCMISTLSLHDALPIFVTFNHTPAIVPQSIIDGLQYQCQKMNAETPPPIFQRGQRVLIQDGCFKDLEAIVMANSRSEEHTSELQSRENLVCRLLLEKKK